MYISRVVYFLALLASYASAASLALDRGKTVSLALDKRKTTSLALVCDASIVERNRSSIALTCTKKTKSYYHRSLLPALAFQIYMYIVACKESHC
jgi:hypothetical protein